MKSQKKIGVTLNYLAISLNMAVSIFFTPFLIKSLGDVEYAIYRTIQSFAGPLAIISFGVGTILQITVARHRARNGTKEEKENFLFMGFMVTTILALLVATVGACIYPFLSKAYDDNFTSAQIVLAQRLFWLFVANTAMLLFSDSFLGIISGHEKFAFNGLVKVGRLIFRIITLIILLMLGYKSTAIILTDFLLTISMILAEMIFVLGKLKVRIKFHYFDKGFLRIVLTFSGAVMLQMVVNQANQNIGVAILGAMVAPALVTIYSVATTVYTSFSSITSVIAGVFVPTAARHVEKDADGEALTDLILRPGRYQLMMAVLVVFGFALCGQNFITIWVGAERIDAYYLALILIVPVSIPLIQSVANSVLDAMYKRMGRSLILVGMVAVNITVSIALIKLFNSIGIKGYYGTAIGTAISLIVGHGIIINLYFKKVFGFNIKRYFSEVIVGILPSGLFAAVICLPFAIFLPNTFLMLLVKGITFVVPYFIFLYFKGMNQSEKATIDNMLIKMKLKKRGAN